jgi:hypothetical protein
VRAVRYRCDHFLRRTCGRGLSPFDRDPGMTMRVLTPSLERVAALAGTVADHFEKG